MRKFIIIAFLSILNIGTMNAEGYVYEIKTNKIVIGVKVPSISDSILVTVDGKPLVKEKPDTIKKEEVKEEDPKEKFGSTLLTASMNVFFTFVAYIILLFLMGIMSYLPVLFIKLYKKIRK